MNGRLFLLVPPALLALAACSSSGGSSGGGAYGGGGGSSPSSSAPVSSSPSAKAAAVRITLSSGRLVGPDGHTLYSNSADTPGHLICTGSCLTIWPPVEGTPAAGAGVAAGDFGTVQRGSATQITYKGHPLYEFQSDMKAGEERGAGLTDQGGTWQPAGPAAAKSSSASHGGGGYGYP
ncbi:MAG: hypothetical protein ACRDVG_14165 [Jatrophihabitantaceae bacterium]